MIKYIRKIKKVSVLYLTLSLSIMMTGISFGEGDLNQNQEIQNDLQQIEILVEEKTLEVTPTTEDVSVNEESVLSEEAVIEESAPVVEEVQSVENVVGESEEPKTLIASEETVVEELVTEEIAEEPVVEETAEEAVVEETVEEVVTEETVQEASVSVLEEEQSIEDVTPEAEEVKPSIEEETSIDESNKAIEEEEQVVPATEEPVSETSDEESVVEESTQTESVESSSEELPATKETQPILEESLPIEEEVQLPVVEEIPLVEEALPVLEEVVIVEPIQIVAAPKVYAKDYSNTIGGIDTSMEYRVGEDWIKYDGSEVYFKGEVDVYVRYSQTEEASASEETKVSFHNNSPSIRYDGASGSLVGLNEDIMYQINDGEWTTYDSQIGIDLAGARKLNFKYTDEAVRRLDACQ